MWPEAVSNVRVCFKSNFMEESADPRNIHKDKMMLKLNLLVKGCIFVPLAQSLPCLTSYSVLVSNNYFLQ